MSLRLRFTLYLAAVHLLLAIASALFLVRHRIWLLAAEAVFVVSLAVGIRLVRSLFGTLDVVRSGAEFIAEKEFTTRFPESGVEEMDALVRIYNSMAERLRDERVRTEEQRHFFDRVLTVSPLGIVTLDYDGRVAALNPAAERMLRREAATLIGTELTGTDDPFAAELAAMTPGDTRVLPLWGSRRVRCYRGEFLDRGFGRGYYTMEEMTEELRQTEKAAYERLIRIMSHEVNNSVGAAGSLLESCKHYAGQLRVEDREDFRKALEVVIARTSQLNSFMRGFADVFRVPAPRRAPCNVPDILQAARVLLGADLERRKILVEWRREEFPAQVSADSAQLEQVFVNLLKNAAEAIGEEGRIVLNAGTRDGRGFVVVEDSGSGMTADVREQLFTPFFSTKQNGQGIGLTLVREILEQHQFDFAIDSRAGGPTRFTIYF